MKALLHVPTGTICVFRFKEFTILSYNIIAFKKQAEVVNSEVTASKKYESLDQIIKAVCLKIPNWHRFYERNKLPDTVSPEEFEIIDIKEDLIP